MVLPPSGPPPPTVPEGWKAHWNVEYKAWFYENIYTEESVWALPTTPVYPPQPRAPHPPGPPPGYQATQQPAPADVKSADPASLPNTMAAVSLSDGAQQGQPQQQPYNPTPPPNSASPLPNSQSLYSATPQVARAPSPQPPGAGPALPETNRDYNPQAPQYGAQSAYGAYPPQQQPPAPGYPPQQQYNPAQGYPPPQQAPAPGYPPQQQYNPAQGYPPQQQERAPGYPPQQQAPGAGYPPQQQYGQQPGYPDQSQYAPGQPQPQAPPPQKAGGFMGMLQGKVGNKVPGGAGTVLGLGGGLLAGAVLEHEWDKHSERRHHHHGGGFGLGGLMRGFDGPPVVENITVNEDVYVDDSYVNF